MALKSVLLSVTTVRKKNIIQVYNTDFCNHLNYSNWIEKASATFTCYSIVNGKNNLSEWFFNVCIQVISPLKCLKL